MRSAVSTFSAREPTQPNCAGRVRTVREPCARRSRIANHVRNAFEARWNRARAVPDACSNRVCAVLELCSNRFRNVLDVFE
eukprot:7983704-Lingulodinium_polyedra.AAC.1